MTETFRAGILAGQQTSELEDGPETERCSIFEGLSRVGPGRIGRAATWMHEVLKGRLQGPAWAQLILIDRCHKRLETSRRPARAHQLLKIDVERMCASRDMGISAGNAELVFRPGVAQSDEFDTAVGVAIDQVSVRRTR